MIATIALIVSVYSCIYSRQNFLWDKRLAFYNELLEYFRTLEPRDIKDLREGYNGEIDDETVELMKTRRELIDRILYSKSHVVRDPSDFRRYDPELSWIVEKSLNSQKSYFLFKAEILFNKEFKEVLDQFLQKQHLEQIMAEWYRQFINSQDTDFEKTKSTLSEKLPILIFPNSLNEKFKPFLELSALKALWLDLCTIFKSTIESLGTGQD